MSSQNSDPVSYGKVGSALVLSLLPAIYASLATPRFAEWFNGFGAPLPFLTEFVLGYYPLTWLLPFTVLMVAFLHPDRAAKGRVCLIIGLIGSSVLFVLINVALYLPIHKMGAVVQ